MFSGLTQKESIIEFKNFKREVIRNLELGHRYTQFVKGKNGNI